MHQLEKETQDTLKLKKNGRRKVKISEKACSMLEVIQKNNDKLYAEESGLDAEKALQLKRENLLIVQQKFYEVMEKNP